MWAASCNEVVRNREESVQRKKLTLGHGQEAKLQLVAEAMMPHRQLQLCSRSYYDHCRWRPSPGDPSTWEVGCNAAIVHCKGGIHPCSVRMAQGGLHFPDPVVMCCCLRCLITFRRFLATSGIQRRNWGAETMEKRRSPNCTPLFGCAALRCGQTARSYMMLEKRCIKQRRAASHAPSQRNTESA